MNPIKEDLVVMQSIVIVLCLLLPSCTKQSLHREKNDTLAVIDDSNQNDYKDYFDRIIQQEAMLVNIPIPLFDERIIDFSSDTIQSDTLFFGYKSPLSKDQAVDFFLKHMERLGWKHLVSFETAEIVLQFKNPDQYCTIIIKNGLSLSGSCIFIYIKRASIMPALK